MPALPAAADFLHPSVALFRCRRALFVVAFR
jgi:hypothetical protein